MAMDWKHEITRKIVQKADPDLSRSVIVNTKLDTKLCLNLNLDLPKM